MNEAKADSSQDLVRLLDAAIEEAANTNDCVCLRPQVAVAIRATLKQQVKLEVALQELREAEEEWHGAYTGPETTQRWNAAMQKADALLPKPDALDNSR